jgi:hypothetical protein
VNRPRHTAAGTVATLNTSPIGDAPDEAAPTPVAPSELGAVIDGIEAVTFRAQAIEFAGGLNANSADVEASSGVVAGLVIAS